MKRDFSANEREPQRAHLAKFAETFVQREHRSRWIHLLCERPEKAGGALHKFEWHFDPRVCTEMDPKADRDATLLASFGDVMGVYFDGHAGALTMRLSDVLDKIRPFQDDALFSIEPGRSAVFFHHDGVVWICRETRVREA